MQARQVQDYSIHVGQRMDDQFDRTQWNERLVIWLSAARSEGALQLQWNWGSLQGSTNLNGWSNMTASNPTNTTAIGLTNYLFSSGAVNLEPTNLPMTDLTHFFRLKLP